VDLRGRAAAVVLALAVSALAPTAAAAPAPGPLRALASGAGLRIGATLEPGQIADPQHSATLAREFSSLTPENAMKWYAIEPQRDQVDYAGADAVVAFAEANGMEVRGHNLVWAQDRYTPAWVVALTDPDELRAELAEHVRGILERYRGRVHRWDVVNEPLETAGTATSGSVFERVLGPGWIADTFRLAHEVDPTAELWLNEYGTDLSPLKHEALLALVRSLLAEGVPIDGIGIQTHRPTPDGPDRARFQAELQQFADLGLAVAITELDVATGPDDPGVLRRQAEAYRTIVTACLAVTSCEEVTTWGVSDRDTWLDALGLLPTPTRPLLFDDAFAPKPAYDAVAEVLADGRAAARASTPPSTTTTAPPPTTAPPAPARDRPAPAVAVPGAARYAG